MDKKINRCGSCAFIAENKCTLVKRKDDIVLLEDRDEYVWNDKRACKDYEPAESTILIKRKDLNKKIYISGNEGHFEIDREQSSYELMKGNKMNLCLYAKQNIRISTRQQKIFIDIECLENEYGLSMEYQPSNSENAPYRYMELREKNGFLKMFCFERKDVKEYAIPEYWQNAKVIWAKNFNSAKIKV